MELLILVLAAVAVGVTLWQIDKDKQNKELLFLEELLSTADQPFKKAAKKPTKKAVKKTAKKAVKKTAKKAAKKK
jgi:uncharacterized protein HemX